MKRDFSFDKRHRCRLLRHQRDRSLPLRWTTTILRRPVFPQLRPIKIDNGKKLSSNLWNRGNGVASKHRYLVDADSGKFPREGYRAIAPLSVRLGASANFSPFFRSLITNVLFSPKFDQGPRGTSPKSTKRQSVTSVSFNPR